MNSYRDIWYVKILHEFPHLDFSFQETNSTFEPENRSYQEVKTATVNYHLFKSIISIYSDSYSKHITFSLKCHISFYNRIIDNANSLFMVNIQEQWCMCLSHVRRLIFCNELYDCLFLTQQSLILWGAAPVAFILVILFLASCCLCVQCVKKKPQKAQRTTCIRILVAIFIIFSM